MDLKDKFQNKKYFYLYRGMVVNNKDPKNGGRVQVRIFELHGLPETSTPGAYPVYTGEKDTQFNHINDDDLPWAEVIQNIDYIGFYPAPSDGQDEYASTISGTGSKSGYKTITRSGKHAGTGYNRILAEGTWVFCFLENGNPNYPIVIGSIAADNEMHKNSSPNDTRIYDSLTGHYEEWSDDKGNIIFHHRSGTTITMNSEGEMHFNTVKIKKEYVQEDSLLHVDGNLKEYVQKDHLFKGDANRDINIKSNDNEVIGSNQAIDIGSNQTIKIGSNQTVNAGGNIRMTTGGKIFLN